MARLLLLILFFGLALSPLHSQIKAPHQTDLQTRYAAFKETAITTKRFSIEELIPVMERHPSKTLINFKVAAHSIEDRPIYLAEYGHGKIPVLFWSQMHGDESTATMALFDLFNYLESDQSEDVEFLKSLREHCTLYFIPMLNPDGAARFSRRNAANIDLNRDALRLSNPESQLLKTVRDSLKPEFGFNLHDQSIYYRAGKDGNQVAMAFLAPAFDYDKNINGVRMKSMQLISILRDSLSQIIPDRIAVYDDSFEPRAFGDNIQKWGTSTILIESGGYPNDPEKQFIRELNFITLIKALESILSGSYVSKTLKEYNAIPQNDRKMMSLILRNLTVQVKDKPILMDVGFQYSEYTKDGQTIYPSRITDVGDLSVNSGLEEFQAKGYNLIQGMWYPKSFKNTAELQKSNWQKMIREGYLGFIVEDSTDDRSDATLHMAAQKPTDRADPLSLTFAPGQNPTFIMEKGNERMIVQNGKIFSVEEYIAEVGL
ncbi:hypothetical protein KUV50_18845 [Membranicola marinus]|uniref:Peptidase M14 domain-containing protein n=1 Tax=Membranihabitans marinus TaxID=1227546 RepID=A0A953HQA4_9BACT|nr:M14 family zinc carboxypeptidase [Membranihabitans marinus]MBY5960219.1 hypothetical protein [Membranihabitans marinus]